MLILFLMSTYGFIFLVKILNINIEKLLVILFALAIPFITDLNIIYREDFHMVSKQYYRFNIIQILALFFLILVLKKINSIKFDIDLLILFSFNLICFTSVFYATNRSAAFFDYVRYIIVSIIYIYFSRIFNYKEYKELLMKYLIIGQVIQLIIGILQKIKGGAIGLKILGEGSNVFRINVPGYEKGMSGTFGHPGPYAIYSLFILSWLLFDKKIGKGLRQVGLIVCTSIIILAAGRTSILLMGLVYFVYIFQKMFSLNAKNFLLSIFILMFMALMILMFHKNIQPVIDRFATSDMELQFNSRFKHVEIAIHYIKQNPIWGAGLNNYLDLTYRDYPIQFNKDFFLSNPIHNAYLLYAVEIGILGLAAYVLFLINSIRYIRRDWSKTKQDYYHVVRGYGIALFVYIIYNFQGWGGIKDKILIMLMLTSAFIYIQHNEIKKRKTVGDDNV